MAEVFLSYTKADLPIAERVSAALRTAGLDVWWDDRLTPETSWDSVLEREISGAGSVVVLWTPRSVSSEWVRTEAHYGQDHGKLVPVMMEDCAVPLAFMLRQTLRLVEWQGDPACREWRKLLTWIADLAAAKPGNGVSMQPSATTQPGRFHDVVGRLPSGEPVVDGALVNAATPALTAFQDGQKLPVMRILPRGAFLLGSPESDPDRAAVEGPQCRVEIPVPFALGVYPLLVAEYQQVLGEPPPVPKENLQPPRWLPWRTSKPTASKSVGPASDPTLPVTQISFVDAQEFVARLSKLSGETYRIPSEAEWEYACRAGSRTRYNCGDSIDSSRALFAAAAGPRPPGGFRPNAFGLYDMHGNVREWTSDLWHESYQSTPLDGSPDLSGHSGMRVVRGGAWCDEASLLRSPARMRATQQQRQAVIGVRVARNLK
jgi:formylglycine-generating enzyme required for sulfatase activity